MKLIIADIDRRKNHTSTDVLRRKKTFENLLIKNPNHFSRYPENDLKRLKDHFELHMRNCNLKHQSRNISNHIEAQQPIGCLRDTTFEKLEF